MDLSWQTGAQPIPFYSCLIVQLSLVTWSAKRQNLAQSPPPSDTLTHTPAHPALRSTAHGGLRAAPPACTAGRLEPAPAEAAEASPVSVWVKVRDWLCPPPSSGINIIFDPVFDPHGSRSQAKQDPRVMILIAAPRDPFDPFPGLIIVFIGPNSYRYLFLFLFPFGFRMLAFQILSE
jgi:hypothetical protein